VVAAEVVLILVLMELVVLVAVETAEQTGTLGQQTLAAAAADKTPLQRQGTPMELVVRE
jgi:hypothetical protein